MKKIESTDPKDFWALFSKDVEEGEGVFLAPSAKGLSGQTTDNTDKPGDVFHEARIGKENFVAFLQILVALRGGRPVKFVHDTKAYWKIFIGPKPK